MQKIRIFVSFASSLIEDRDLVQTVLKDISMSLPEVDLDVTMWEKRDAGVAMPASITPQEAINRGLPTPRETDIFLLIVRDRIGTPFVSWDGEQYAGSPAWEYNMAVKSRSEKGLPFIFVYRHSGQLEASALSQIEEVEQFLQQYSERQEATRGLLIDFESHEELAALIQEHVVQAIHQYWLQKDRTKSPIFVSYSRKDWDTFVSPLVRRFEKADLNVWIDQHLLEGGEDWLDEINEALKTCKRMVLCVSPDAMLSRHVKLEYRYLFNHGKLLYPIICRSTELPAELQTIQYYPYHDLDKLIEILKQ